MIGRGFLEMERAGQPPAEVTRKGSPSYGKSGTVTRKRLASSVVRSFDDVQQEREWSISGSRHKNRGAFFSVMSRNVLDKGILIASSPGVEMELDFISPT
ncbi:hypothetical protein TNCV_2949921 [Trichonephila clavipes]|nr:hypothetical protein TNCV_2949921 [Trichonephila clavipes]